MKSVEGTAEDRALLESYGWRLATDANGFANWIGPKGAGVVHLYADETWSGGPECFEILEDYLKWFKWRLVGMEISKKD
jgi:hypothetical protein